VLAQREAALELVKAALSDEEKKAAREALKAVVRRVAQPELVLLAEGALLALREASAYYMPLAAPSEAVAPSEAAAVAPGGASVLQREVAVALREAALTLREAVFAQREAAVSLIEAEMDLR
jgi:hypothetical protein